MIRYFMLVLMCGPLPAFSQVTSTGLAFALDRCVIPQIEGLKIATVGLVPITPQEAGALLEEGEPAPDFYASPTGGHILGEIRFGPLQACTVPRFVAADFDDAVDVFLTQVQNVGLVTSPSCRNVRIDGNNTVMATSSELSARGYFVTAVLAEATETGLVSIFTYETLTTNLPLNCTVDK